MRNIRHPDFTGWDAECRGTNAEFDAFKVEDASRSGLDAGVQFSDESGIVTVTIRSNREQNSKVLLIGTIFLAVVLTCIGIIFAIFGIWLVLPFAGLELVVLCTCVQIVSTQNRDNDRLAISDKYVHLTRIRRSGQTVNSFIRQWTRVRLEAGSTKHEPLKLLVGSHGQYREVGQHLVDHSKRRVHQQLKTWISNDLSSDT